MSGPGSYFSKINKKGGIRRLSASPDRLAYFFSCHRSISKKTPLTPLLSSNVYTCPDHSDRPHDPIERSTVRQWDPKFVQLCQETPYFEVFITTFHAVAGHVCWLAERGPRGVRDLVFKGRSKDKASIIVCKAMLTPTTTLAGPNGSCLTMYTYMQSLVRIDHSAFLRLMAARPYSCDHGRPWDTLQSPRIRCSLGTSDYIRRL